MVPALTELGDENTGRAGILHVKYHNTGNLQIQWGTQAGVITSTLPGSPGGRLPRGGALELGLEGRRSSGKCGPKLSRTPETL